MCYQFRFCGLLIDKHVGDFSFCIYHLCIADAAINYCKFGVESTISNNNNNNNGYF